MPLLNDSNSDGSDLNFILNCNMICLFEITIFSTPISVVYLVQIIKVQIFAYSAYFRLHYTVITVFLGFLYRNRIVEYSIELSSTLLMSNWSFLLAKSSISAFFSCEGILHIIL